MSRRQPSWWGPTACLLGACSWMTFFAVVVIIQRFEAQRAAGQLEPGESLAAFPGIARVALGAAAIFALSGFALAIADMLRSDRRRGWTYLALFICGCPGVCISGMFLMSLIG